MHKMQSAGPQIAYLYMDCLRLLHAVLSCFIKSSALPGDTTGDDLVKLDLSKDNKDLSTMSPSASDCYKKLSKTNQKNAASTVVKMLKAIAQYLQKELHPLRSKLV